MYIKMSKTYKLKFLKNATQPKNETFFQAKVVKIWSFGLQSLWPIPSAVRSELKTVPSLAHQNNVVDPTCGTIFRGPSCQGLLFYDFSLSLLIFILVWTHKMAFLGQKECKKFLLIKRFGGPWDLWHFCSNNAGTS